MDCCLMSCEQCSWLEKVIFQRDDDGDDNDDDDVRFVLV